jgi:hypothetical protein
MLGGAGARLMNSPFGLTGLFAAMPPGAAPPPSPADIAAIHPRGFQSLAKPLVRGGDDPWDLRIVRFAVHARALRAPEPIGALPTGEYEVVLEAEDSGYETEPTPLRVLPGHQTLTFDARDAGLLLLDLRAGRALHDGRCALRIDDAQGGHFYSTFDRAPYVVPFLVPGRYVLSEIDAPGCAVLAPETPFEIFPGELTVELATCEPASGGGEPR